MRLDRLTFLASVQVQGLTRAIAGGLIRRDFRADLVPKLSGVNAGYAIQSSFIYAVQGA
jgi:hypothetical protein